MNKAGRPEEFNELFINFHEYWIIVNNCKTLILMK